MEIQNGQFYWPSVSNTVGKTKKYSDVLARAEEEVKAAFRLKNFTFKAKKGCLTVIIGKVASGKSSAILSVLGEMPIYLSNSKIATSGMKYSKNGQIGFVGQ